VSGVELPYRCEKMRSETLRRPCEQNVAKAKELRQKFPHALLGPIEYCLECKGENLHVREGAVIHLEAKTRPGDELVTAPIAPPGPSNLPDIDHTAPPDRKKAEMEIMPKLKGPQAGTPAPLSPRCPKHPHEPQVQCGPDSKRAGQYLGACKVCMAERKVGRKKKGVKEKMTPAVRRDLRKGGSASVKGAVVFKTEAEAERVLGPGKVPPDVRQTDLVQPEINVQPPEPTCNNHPDRPAKIDRLGRSMAMCAECLSIRGRKAGIGNHERGLTSPPVSIPLNQAKYAEVRDWLETSAEENERSLQNEIMYQLKLAMRGAV
jgi:hypothetical protein